MPKWSDSDSGSVKSDDETVTEFGPDILKMLNISQDRDGTRTKPSSRHQSCHIPHDNQIRSVRVNSCPLMPVPVSEGHGDETNQTQGNLLDGRASGRLNTPVGQQIVALANQYLAQSDSRDVPPSSFDSFWLPDLATPRITASNGLLHDSKSDSSSDESISSFSLYIDAAFAETKEKWDKSRVQGSTMHSSSDTLDCLNTKTVRDVNASSLKIKKEVNFEECRMDFDEMSRDASAYEMNLSQQEIDDPEQKKAVLDKQESLDLCNLEGQAPRLDPTDDSLPGEKSYFVLFGLISFGYLPENRCIDLDDLYFSAVWS